MTKGGVFFSKFKVWISKKWIEIKIIYDESYFNPRYMPVGTIFYIIVLFLGAIPFLLFIFGIIKVQGGFFHHIGNVTFSDSLSLFQFYFSVLAYFVGSYAVWQYLKSFNKKIKPVLTITPAQNILDNRHKGRGFMALVSNEGNTAIMANELRYEIFFADGIEIGIEDDVLANLRKVKRITNTDLVPLAARINKHDTTTQMVSGIIPENVYPQESAILLTFYVKNDKSISGDAYYYFLNKEQYFPKNVRLNNSKLIYNNLAKKKVKFLRKK